MTGSLSVVMPVYNTAPALLERSVGSLTAQTYKDLEIILVDDGSREETAEKLDRLAVGDPRIRVIHQENRGASAARNAGIRAASGRFLTMMDADDSIAREAFETVIRKLLRTGADACVFGWESVSVKGQRKAFPVLRGQKAALEKPTRILPAMLIGDRLRGGGYPWNKVWDLYQTGSPELFDEDLYSYEDKLWCVRMYQKCRAVLLLPETFYTYYQAEISLSRAERSGAGAAAAKRKNALTAYDRIMTALPRRSAACAAAGLFRYKTIIMGILKGTG